MEDELPTKDDIEARAAQEAKRERENEAVIASRSRVVEHFTADMHEAHVAKLPNAEG